MNIFSILFRRYINIKYKGSIELGHDTNVTFKNLNNKGGNICIHDSVIVRDGVLFSCNTGGALEVESGVFFNRNCIIACHKRIIIGENTIFGPNVCIYDHNHKFSKKNGIRKNEFNCDDIQIGKGCWIGANVVILKGTILGDNCVVSAGTVLQGRYTDGTLIINKQVLQTETIY